MLGRDVTTDDDRVGRHGVLSANRLERSQIGDDSLLVALERYWNDLRGERRMPSPSEIDPLEIGTALLPWIFLLDVIEDAGSRDYFYRLAGTSNVELVGRDPTGRPKCRKKSTMSFGSSADCFRSVSPILVLKGSFVSRFRKGLEDPRICRFHRRA